MAKAKTIRMTRVCKVCECGFTYKSEERLKKGDVEGHICNACKKLIKG